MEKQIDWSKAPEGATHVGVVNSTRVCWYKIEANGDYCYTYHIDGIACGEWKTGGNNDPHHKPLITRPATWSGEGLPPVGVVCELYDSNPHDYYRKHVGQHVTIIAHSTGGDDDPTAVYKVFSGVDCQYHALVAKRFRPIKTAEQIALEERQKAIDAMLDEFPGLAAKNAVRIINAGYRKQ